MTNQYAFVKKEHPLPAYDSKNYENYKVKCWGIDYDGVLCIKNTGEFVAL